MRIDFTLLALTLFSSAAASVIGEPRNVIRVDVDQASTREFWKRRGGGGGGGGRGGGGSSGGSSSKGGSSGGSSSSSGSKSPSSNTGGSSKGGSGPGRYYGGGGYYGGGAATPYRSGKKSPLGIAPFFFVGAALAFWPGVWLYGAYLYNYDEPYRFRNASSGEDEERDVVCACGTFEVCGCDDNKNTTFLDELIGDGTYSKLNKSVVNVAEVNGTTKILINGTLPNGTTVDSEDSAAGRSMRSAVEFIGYWPAFAAVLAAVFMA